MRLLDSVGVSRVEEWNRPAGASVHEAYEVDRRDDVGDEGG